ncbi:DinB family protein [Deinococcus arenicola]|uniref:DinB family protein n=1 Tax=Deinococcus arenicola TaxID=2994950 RepID=A0ABU4DR20_9DEIO|nr:DinB family protein [Deinococcus sp. ZS9-10]MDV6374407.1 DinB family protein [Deinococcus sp. ZS9-10]
MTPAGRDPATRDDLLRALADSANEIGGYFAGLDAAQFVDGNAAQWSPAHHLDHLIRSNLPVASGLGAARGRLQPLPAQHQVRTHAQIRDDYRAVLATGGKAFGRLLPQPEGSQTELVERYVSSLNAVGEALAHWTDAELDNWAMPHPALNVLSIREMALFTLMHNWHHLNGVRRQMLAPQTVSTDNGAT